MSKATECFAYNTKIIETPTTKEVYIYENPIFTHSTAKQDSAETSKRKTFDEMSARRQYDSLKRKQFVKGTMQIAQEGAIQIFHEPNTGMEEVIVGVVGTLQFDVFEYRLKNEYNVEIRQEGLSYQYLRWIENEEFDPKQLDITSDTKLVQDFRDRYLLLFTDEWNIRWAQEKNPWLKLAEFGRS